MRFTFLSKAMRAIHLGASSFRRFLGERVGFRALQATALVILVCFSLGATDAGSRFNDLGHRMMCTCGCAQLLGECNHVGCPNSTGERDELSAAIAAGSSDQEIMSAFSVKYGATVLAAPTTKGFDLVAWIAPFAFLAAGLLLAILLVVRWSEKKTQLAAVAPGPSADAIREKIRRETGSDGGF
jgi:cytochrome c-type biogenesis protein CcmH